MVKGKNFSCNNVGGKRKASDFYETPYCLTRELLNVVELKEPILEPARGGGAITKVLREYGYKDITEYDLEQGTDFFNETRHFKTIITNPPYSKSFAFIAKAKEVCDEFYFLLPLSYLHGKQRYDNLYKPGFAYPLERIFCFTRYPMLGETLNADGTINTGMMVYCYFHFNKFYNGDAPTIHWLDIDKYILRKTKQ